MANSSPRTRTRFQENLNYKVKSSLLGDSWESFPCEHNAVTGSFYVHIFRLLLDGDLTARLVPPKANRRAHRFDIIDKTGNLYSFAASSQESAETWVHKINSPHSAALTAEQHPLLRPRHHRPAQTTCPRPRLFQTTSPRRSLLSSSPTPWRWHHRPVRATRLRSPRLPQKPSSSFLLSCPLPRP